MRNALRELRRRPTRFLAVTGALGAAHRPPPVPRGAARRAVPRRDLQHCACSALDVVVYSADANDSLIRSRIGPELRAEVAAAPGVRAVGGLGLSLVGAEVPGQSDLVDAAVIGYERRPTGVPAPPPAGAAWVDRRLEAFGVHQGDTLRLGPAEVPIRVRGWVEDTNYLLQGALWVSPATWRKVQNMTGPIRHSRPGRSRCWSWRAGPTPAPWRGRSTAATTARPRR